MKLRMSGLLLGVFLMPLDLHSAAIPTHKTNTESDDDIAIRQATLNYFIDNGKLKELQEFLAKNAGKVDINYASSSIRPYLVDSPLKRAVMRVGEDHAQEIVELLLASGADPLVLSGKSALHSPATAFENSALEEIISDWKNNKLSSKAGFEVIFNRILNAAIAKDPAIINKPLAIGYHTGKTLLGLATERHNAPAVRVLLAHKANINQADARGKTPLQIEAENHNPEVKKLLDEAAIRPLLLVEVRNSDAAQITRDPLDIVSQYTT